MNVIFIIKCFRHFESRRVGKNLSSFNRFLWAGRALSRTQWTKNIIYRYLKLSAGSE